MADFKTDLYDTTIQLLNHYGVRYKKKDDLFHLLIKLYTFLEKYIDPHKRTVFNSNELISKIKTLPITTQESLSKIEKWINDGVDINCFQGRGLYGDGSRDYQNALYGIVHLHLSAKEVDSLPVIHKGKFAKPGKYVLFALFRKDFAFFIDVVPHPQTLSEKNPRVTEWTSADLIKIIENNWPTLLSTCKIPIDSLCDSKGNEVACSDGDIAELTVNHATTFIKGNQGFYMLGLGVSTSGDNTKAVVSAQKEIRNATICEDHFLKHLDEIKAIFIRQLSDAGIPVPNEFDFHYDYIPELKNHFIVDRNTGAAFDIFTGDSYTPV